MYRDHIHAAKQRRQHLLEQEALEALDPVFEQIYRARLRRIWAAIAALSAIPGALVWALQPIRTIGRLLGGPFLGSEIEIALVPAWFAAGWVFAAVGAWAAHWAAPHLFARAIARRRAPVGDLFRDLGTLERQKQDAVAHDVVQGLAKRSFVLPLVAVALLAPLTIHLLVAAALGLTLTGFASYMFASAVLVGHAHVLLATLAARHVKLCYQELSAAPAGGPPRSRGWQALGGAVAAACIPGIALMGIPPLLVSLTGAVFVPALFSWAGRRIWHEQLMLSDGVI